MFEHISHVIITQGPINIIRDKTKDTPIFIQRLDYRLPMEGSCVFKDLRVLVDLVVC